MKRRRLLYHGVAISIVGSLPVLVASGQVTSPDRVPESTRQVKAPALVSDISESTPETRPLTGNFLSTLNLSTLGKIAPSINSKLSLDYALPRGQVLDLRVENYYEGSYNQLPAGQIDKNINEHKLEVQGTITFPLTNVFSISPAILHHDNFRFSDSYYWAILTLTAKLPLGKQLMLTPNVSLEKRLSGGRSFYDTSTTLDYAIRGNWTAEINYHRYENLGELDTEPSEKEEQEYGLIRQLPGNRTLSVSFFRHIQHGSVNDQFSQIKFKYGVGF